MTRLQDNISVATLIEVQIKRDVIQNALSNKLGYARLVYFNHFVLTLIIYIYIF